MPRLLDAHERQELLVYLEKRFGLTSTMFDDYFFERSKRDIWMMHKSLSGEVLEREKSGLRSFNGDKHPPKPTTAFLQRFGSLITRSQVDLNRFQFSIFLQGEENFLEDCEIADGYVLVTYQGVAIGCGFLRNKRLQCQFPKNVGRSINQKFL